MSNLTKFDEMMHEFCVGQGFCGSLLNGEPSHVTDFIPSKGVVSANDFVEWLLTAEGHDPKFSPYKRKLIQIFRKHMGSDEVNVSFLR